jgi:hypothetical protein
MQNLGPTPTVDLFVGENRRYVWIAEPKLLWMLTRPLNLAMAPRRRSTFTKI